VSVVWKYEGNDLDICFLLIYAFSRIQRVPNGRIRNLMVCRAVVGWGGRTRLLVTIEESRTAVTKRSAMLRWTLTGCRQCVPEHQHVHPPFASRLWTHQVLLEITHVFITLRFEAREWRRSTKVSSLGRKVNGLLTLFACEQKTRVSWIDLWIGLVASFLTQSTEV
jgi:hypothetical protein